MTQMKKVTDTQIASALRDYEFGEKASVVAKGLGISHQALTYWLPYAGLNAMWLRYVRNLETKYKRLAVKAKRDHLCLTAATSVIKGFQPSAKRRSLIATALRAQFRLNRERANCAVGLGKTAGEFRQAHRVDNVLIEMMRRYAADNPGQGFRPMFAVLLKDQPGTRERALRLYTQFHMHVKARALAKARPLVTTRRHMPVQTSINAMWSMDFMQDALMTGERFWVFNAIDDCNREAITLQVLKRRSARAVIEALQEVVGTGRKPVCIRTDNGGEFKSLVYKNWTQRRAIMRKYSRPHCPTDNVNVELFNKSVRTEVLRRYEFRSLAEVQRSLDDWQLRYNFSRPHLALGGLSPMQYAYVLSQRR